MADVAEILLTQSEIAAGIAGFTGIAIALGRDRAQWTYLDLVNVWFLLAHSIIGFIASQLPIVLASDQYPWPDAIRFSLRVFAGMVSLGVAVAIRAAIRALSDRSQRRQALDMFFGKAIVAAIPLAAVVSGLLALASFQALAVGDLSIYVGSVATVLLLALLHFGYLIESSFRAKSD